MKTFGMKLGVSAIFGLTLAGAAFSASIKWAAGFDSAVANAKASHRLLMVDFYTDWCGWCKKLDKDTYEAPAIVSASENFVPVKLNAEKEGVAQAQKYQVHSYPTILFLKPTGELVWKIGGYMAPDDFAKQMELAKTVETELPKLETEYAKTGGDPALDAKLVAFYEGTDSFSKIQGVADRLGKSMDAKARSLTDADRKSYGEAFNAAGDTFQGANKNDQAIIYFKRAEKVGTPKQIAYARMSLVECYMATGQNALAREEAQKLLSMGPEADPYRSIASQVVKQSGS